MPCIHYIILIKNNRIDCFGYSLWFYAIVFY